MRSHSQLFTLTSWGDGMEKSYLYTHLDGVDPRVLEEPPLAKGGGFGLQREVEERFPSERGTWRCAVRSGGGEAASELGGRICLLIRAATAFTAVRPRLALPVCHVLEVGAAGPPLNVSEVGLVRDPLIRRLQVYWHCLSHLERNECEA